MRTIRCSSCSSENVQKLSLVHAQGLVNVNLETAGTSAGIGGGVGTGGLGVGVGVARNSSRTTGTQQTDLSKMTAPPTEEFLTSQKAVWIGCALAGLISYPMFRDVDQSSSLSIVLQGGIALAVFGFVFAIGFALLNAVLVPKAEKQAAKERHAAALREWDQKFLCLTCGGQFRSS